MGAFKFRGAYNFIATLSPARTGARRRRLLERQSRAGRRARGAAARSAGDDRHADRRAGRQARRDARVRRRDRSPTSASARIAKRSPRGIAAERGATLVPPFDDARIVAGAGTAALEFWKMLVAGCDRRAAGRRRIDGRNGDRRPRPRPVDAMYGVEPQEGDDFARSLELGEPVTIGVPKQSRMDCRRPRPAS